MTSPIRTDQAVDRALEWLRDAQEPSGEFTSYASALDGDERLWVPDALKFITALVVLALDEIPDERAAELVDHGVEFLCFERETMAQWRYWAASNEQYDFTPPDADDTACCSLAVATRGHRTNRNRSVLLANRDPQGRFYTWLIPHGHPPSPRLWWAMRDELRSAVRRRRAELWATTEATPDDVDGVVNMNVLRYLGSDAPQAATSWVAGIIDAGREDDCDSWHRNRYTMYAALADDHRRGVPGLDQVGSTVVDRIHERVDADGTVGPPLDTAFALLALNVFGAENRLRARLAGALRSSQREDGSWERSVFYYGGPQEIFGWASEALTTASCAQVLHREAGTS